MLDGNKGRGLPKSLARINSGLVVCRVQASVYAKCCTANLPAIQHKQCQSEFDEFLKCMKKVRCACISAGFHGREHAFSNGLVRLQAMPKLSK
jgi:hypothetical protein